MQLQSLDDVLALYIKERMPSADMQRQLDVVLRSLRRISQVYLLSDIQREVLFQWRDHLLHERQVSVVTWNNYWRHLKTLLNFAVEHGWDSSHLKGVKRLPERKHAKKVISHEGIQAIIGWLRQDKQANMPGWFWEAVLKTLYYTGMRRRQLVGLQWRDILWDENAIRLRADNSKTRTEWLIPLPEPLRDSLVDLQMRTRVRLQLKQLTTEQVFNITLFNPKYQAQQMTVEHVSGAFRRIRRRVGVDVSSHRFRHTFATSLAKQGRIKELQYILGHTDVRTTLGYVQPDLNGMADLVKGLSVS